MRPSVKEGRMNCDSATKSNRKSGVAKWRDLQFRGPLLEMFPPPGTPRGKTCGRDEARMRAGFARRLS
jgi:hypothetical protein